MGSRRHQLRRHTRHPTQAEWRDSGLGRGAAASAAVAGAGRWQWDRVGVSERGDLYKSRQASEGAAATTGCVPRRGRVGRGSASKGPEARMHRKGELDPSSGGSGFVIRRTRARRRYEWRGLRASGRYTCNMSEAWDEGYYAYPQRSPGARGPRLVGLVPGSDSDDPKARAARCSIGPGSRRRGRKREVDEPDATRRRPEACVEGMQRGIPGITRGQRRINALRVSEIECPRRGGRSPSDMGHSYLRASGPLPCLPACLPPRYQAPGEA